jgi:hypothetical protein
MRSRSSGLSVQLRKMVTGCFDSDINLVDRTSLVRVGDFRNERLRQVVSRVLGAHRRMW